MAEPLADQVLRKIGEARVLYHRLILVVGLAGSSWKKMKALQGVSASTSALLTNVNLELPRRMLDFSRLVNGMASELLHRELVYSGFLPEGGAYLSRLRACLEVAL
jgi:hypothetical protein